METAANQGRGRLVVAWTAVNPSPTYLDYYSAVADEDVGMGRESTSMGCI